MADMEDLTGRQFGAYQIVAPLGEGGMAAVYKAHQPSMNRHVALKVLPRHLAGDAQFVARFRQEAQLLASLQHPHILPVFDFGTQDGLAYIVMPFVQGGTLNKLLTGRPLPLDDIVRLIDQIGGALGYAHSHGLVHRDVKPSNVLLDTSGNCLLSDFGLAKLAESAQHLTQSGAIMGTPAYMSPEQGYGQKLDGRSDLYALGVILFEMATGRVPFQSETPLAVVIKHLNDPLPPPRDLNPDISPAVESVIQKSLTKRPDDRFQTADEMLRALRDAAESGKPTLIARRPKAEGGRARLPGWAMAAIAIAGVALIAGGAWAIAGGLPATATATLAAVAALPSATTPPPAATGTMTAAPPTATATAEPTITPTPSITPTPQPTASPTLGIGSRQTSPADEMVLVYVPGGEFLMGAVITDTNAAPNERPQRVVTLDPFWIDRTEVTNRQYALCVQAGVCRAPVSRNSASRIGYYTDAAFQDYPVVFISWSDAQTYCRWAGRRLPTEAEWEKAARGTAAGLFPWGDTPPSASRANFNRTRGDTAPAASSTGDASPYGAVDMAGNVWEWVSDWYSGPYYSNAPNVNPQGPATGSTRGLRGGAWDSELRLLRASTRFNFGPGGRENNIGFRCAK